MVDESRRAALEQEGAASVSRFWSGPNPLSMSAIMDDVRARLVDEAWFGQDGQSGWMREAAREYQRDVDAWGRGDPNVMDVEQRSEFGDMLPLVYGERGAYWDQSLERDASAAPPERGEADRDQERGFAIGDE